MTETTVTQREIYRISPEVWEEFKTHLPSRVVTDQTTDLQAGFMLGINFILDKIEKGLVTG